MEAIFSVIIWILVIVSFVNKLNKKRGNAGESDAARMSGRKPSTEYPEKKAGQKELADRKEHYQEWKQAKRENNGTLPAATRLYEGDSVPRGMEQIRCSYCGADNLIPEGSRRKYTCYFCREEL